MVDLASARSETALGNSRKNPEPNKSQFMPKCVTMTIIVLLISIVAFILLAISFANNATTTTSQSSVDPIKLRQGGLEVSASEQFRFQIYCPINKVTEQVIVEAEGD